MSIRSVLTHLLLVAPLALAHPHGVEEREFQHAAQPWYRRSLDHCAEAFSEPEFVKRTIERRHVELRKLRRKRGIEDIPIIHGRDFNTVLNTDHRSNKPYNEDTPATDLFGDWGACMLTPEQTEGPLYVKGEEVRRELTEGEDGVKMTIDIQVVDVRTCQPIPEAAVDFWSCNSTGVYGGVLNYPGNGDPNDLSLINTTTLRGIQFTDAEGMAAFDTVIPGHYAGRTNHVHAIAHLGAVKQPNNTITGGTVSHIGQMYFDQKLLNEMETLPPYSTNHQAVTTNAQDMLMAMSSNNDDPVVRYVLVGNTLADGIYGWIRFGVDTSANRPLNPAAWIDENGGHQGNPNAPSNPGWPWGKREEEEEE